MTPHPRIRRVLRLDAAGGIAGGLLLVAAAGPLAGPLGLPQPLLFWAGVALFPCAGLMLLAAARLSPALCWTVVIGNIAWAAASFALVAILVPTALGAVVLIAQALGVLAFAWFEARALRPSPVPA